MHDCAPCATGCTLPSVAWEEIAQTICDILVKIDSPLYFKHLREMLASSQIPQLGGSSARLGSPLLLGRPHAFQEGQP